MAIDYNLNDPALQGLLAGLDFSGLNNLSGMNFASNFGNGAAGSTGYIADPNLQYIQAPVSNSRTNTGVDGSFYTVTPDQPVRLVDLKTNQVVFEGVGFEAARKATELAQDLTDTLGRKAQYNIQTADPSGAYKTVASEDYNKSTLGQIADVVGTVAPLALSFIPGFGQLGLLAKVAASAGAGGLGAALKGDDILKGALLGGATAGIASGTGLDKALGGVLGGVGGGAVQGAAQAGGQAAGDIVVTGLSKGLQAAGGALGQAALSEAGKAAARALSGYQTPAEKIAQQPLPEALLPPADIYAGIDPIDVLANRATAAAPNYGGVLSGVFEPIATEFLPKSVLPEPLPSEPAIADEAIVVTAPQATAAPIPIPGFETAIPAITGGALTAAQTAGTPPSAKDGFLGTGLSVPQLLSLGSVGADLLQNLMAGDGGAGAGTPYVSPFGTGTGAGFAPRQDMRANPNIADYERYGFGPEAMFFQPQYTGLLPANAAPPQAQPAMTINPALIPLI